MTEILFFFLSYIKVRHSTTVIRQLRVLQIFSTTCTDGKVHGVVFYDIKEKKVNVTRYFFERLSNKENYFFPLVFFSCSSMWNLIVLVFSLYGSIVRKCLFCFMLP